MATTRTASDSNDTNECRSLRGVQSAAGWRYQTLTRGFGHHCREACRRDGITTQRSTRGFDKPDDCLSNCLTTHPPVCGPDRTLTYCHWSVTGRNTPHGPGFTPKRSPLTRVMEGLPCPPSSSSSVPGILALVRMGSTGTAHRPRSGGGWSCKPVRTPCHDGHPNSLSGSSRTRLAPQDFCFQIPSVSSMSCGTFRTILSPLTGSSSMRSISVAAT
jgi:hypothetical protein